ncbi:hypothetical protein [Salipiger sp.]|uniref:hypothetical protein n=1 Tax=Salipiger sp. TaxID=2078585 RepID=UPI003A96CD02
MLISGQMLERLRDEILARPMAPQETRRIDGMGNLHLSNVSREDAPAVLGEGYAPMVSLDIRGERYFVYFRV